MVKSEEILELLATQVAIQSTADNHTALSESIAHAEQYFAIPELKTERYTSNGKVNLLVYAANIPTKKFDVVLNGHLDVVPAPVDLFSLKIDDNKAVGRGVFDMKGPAVVLMKLVKDLASKGQLGSTALTLVTDEEIGGHNGAKFLLEQQHITGNFFLAGEPTDFAICLQQKGILWLELTEKGKAAHGSRPWEGQNANVSLAQKITKFYETYPQPTSKEDWRTSYTLSILRGGTDAKNIVADTCVAYMDIRRIETESAQDVLSKISSVFTDTQIKVLIDEPCLGTDPINPYIQRLQQASQHQLGETPEFARETFGSDARFYSAVGVPAVNFGPVGGEMHGDNEWVDIQSLNTYYAILEKFLLADK